MSGLAGGSEDLYIRVDNAEDFWAGELRVGGIG